MLVYAYRTEAPEHERYAGWLRETISSEQAYGVSELVQSRFLRVVTHPRGMTTPAPLDSALAFAEVLRSQPNALPVASGPRHWTIFARLCQDAGAAGNRVPDAYLAALAIEHGAELVTADRGFARFDGLRWRTPF